MSVNFNGNEIGVAYWGSTKTIETFALLDTSASWSTRTGSIGQTISGSIGLVYSFSTNIPLPEIPAWINKDAIRVSATAKSMGNQISRTTVTQTSEGTWVVKVHGTGIKANALVDIQVTYSVIQIQSREVYNPGTPIQRIYFNNQLVFGVEPVEYSYDLLDDDTYQINYVSGGEHLAQITLPTEYEGVQISTVGDFCSCPIQSVKIPEGYLAVSPHAFEENLDIKRISFPNSPFESIGYQAFSGCSNLERIHVPRCISVGTEAFAYCESLTCFQFPDGTEFISPRVFEGCMNIEYIYIPESVKRLQGYLNSDGEWAPTIYCGASDEDIIYTSSASDTALAWYEEWNDGAMVYYNWPSQGWDNIHISEIDSGVAIYWNSANAMPTNLFLPPVQGGMIVRAIQSHGFSGRNTYGDNISAHTISIPKSVISIGQGAFERQVDLHTFEFQNISCQTDPSIFFGCDSLTTLVVPFVGKHAYSSEKLSRLGYWFDYESDLGNDTVPSTLTTVIINSNWNPGIDTECFLSCGNITTISLNPDSLILNSSPFFRATGLTEFPVVGNNYWKWIDEDYETGEIMDFGGWDLLADKSNSLQEFAGVTCTWSSCHPYTPTKPVITSLTRSGATITVKIKNTSSEAQKYKVLLSGRYQYGGATPQKKTGEISANSTITLTATVPTTSTTGGPIIGATASAYFNGISGNYSTSKSI